MIRLIWPIAIAAAIIISGAAEAQAQAQAQAQGVVRGGEHGDHTRVVVPIGADRDFSVQQQGDRRIITLDPQGEFDTSVAFEVLNADRLLSIENDGNLILQMGCDCEITAVRYLSEYLVIDIYETTDFPGDLPGYPDVSPPAFAARPVPRPLPVDLPEDAPTIARALAARQPYTPRQPLALDLLPAPDWTVARLSPLDAPPRDPEMVADMADMASDPMVAEATEPMDTAMPEMANLDDMPSDDMPSDDMAMTPDMPMEDGPDRTEPMMDAMAHEDSMADHSDIMVPMTEPEPDMMAETAPERPEGLDETIDNLAQQLARATAAGLLETSAMEPFSAGDTPDPDPVEEAVAEDEVEGDPPPTGLPVRAANAFDVAGDRDGGLAAIAAALSCSQPIGDLADWAVGTDFDSGLGELRQAAFDGNGNLLASPTVTLARHYIFHGFGAEAEAWLLQLDNPPQTELSMARYLDDRPGPNFPEVETLALCSGLDLLWRFVDSPDFPELALSQRQEMRLAFNQLPLGLRRMIGPDFVRRLDAEGYDDDATEVREDLSRGPTLDDTETLVLEFETSDDRPTRSATEALENQLRTAGPEAPRVMREYLAALRRAGDQPDESRMIAAEALLRENPPDRAVGSLWYEVLMAHMASGDLETAFEMFGGVADASEDIRRGIESDMVAALLRGRQTAALVVMATRLANQPDGHDLPYGQRMAIFEELTDLGLDALAEPYRTDAEGDSQMTPPPPGQNWGATAAGTDGPAANVARRIADLEAEPAPLDLENSDDVRSTLEDSRALRSELSALLGELPAN